METQSMALDVEFGVQLNSTKLKSMQPLLKGWNKTINKYCSRLEGVDVPYYYGERSNISLLSAGAWASDMIALEEYNTNKKPALGSNPPAHGSSRCDLFVFTDDHHFQIEAKQCWLPADINDNKHSARIETYLKQACEDANYNTESTKRIGCVFFTVWWSTTSSYKRDPIASIRNELQRCLKTTADVLAWSFPTCTRQYKHKQRTGDNRFYPGIIVAMRAGKHFRG
jgi:hypothetical protein